VLQEFADLSGLLNKPEKSTIYSSGVSQLMKEQMKDCLKMEEEKLTVR
jgi:hypothetical protein